MTMTLVATLSVVGMGCESSGPKKAKPSPAEAPDPCDIDAPVCGDDGVEYANACAAADAGATIEWEGPSGCYLDLEDPITKAELKGAWAGYGNWPVHFTFGNGSFTRVDWIANCAFGTECVAEPATSYGTWSISGPLVHLVWTDPAPDPLIQLPSVLLWEPSCPDGKSYLAELEPDPLFYAQSN